MKHYFRFKKFAIAQDKTLMKVNTDGVLLGAWCDCNDKANGHFLDIGTGTGVIAVMLAQRFPEAMIDGLEIDFNSYKQAKENFHNSPWTERLTAINGDFSKYDKIFDSKYDCIISNPPYFENSLLPEGEAVKARHTVALTYEVLAKGTARLLKDNGAFCVILPFEMHEKFMHICNKEELFCKRKTFVYSTSKKREPKRVLLQFVKKIDYCIEDNLVILHNGQYTGQYKDLTKDFYLNF